MNKNPLSTVVWVFIIGDVYSAWTALTKHSVTLLTVVAWIQCVGFVVLYLRQSRYTGTYLFYSILPIFPIYLGLKLIGTTAPLRPAVYVVASIVYLIAMFLLWQMKRNYDRFIEARDAEAAA
jgi:hypothetical protein